MTAIKDDSFRPVHAHGASFFFVKPLLLLLQRGQFLGELFGVVLFHFAGLAFGVGDDVHLLLDRLAALALLPTRAAVRADVLMMTRVELDVSRRLLAEGAARQLGTERLAEEVDDFLRGARGVGDVERRVTLVIAVADFEPLFDGELEAGRLAILDGAVEDGLSVRPLGVDVGAVAEEVLERLDVVAERGVGQRRGAFQISVVDVDAVANGEVDAVDVAAGRRVMQDGLPHVSATVEIGAMLGRRRGGVRFVTVDPIP